MRTKNIGEIGMDKELEFDLLCIGSGPAGQRAAVQAAKVGKRVGMVEKRRVVGGLCLGTGTIPSKTFREAVLAFGKQAEQFRSHHGFSSGERLTATRLLSRVNAVVEREGDVIDRQLQRNDPLRTTSPGNCSHLHILEYSFLRYMLE